jgi:hypothetical protein
LPPRPKPNPPQLEAKVLHQLQSLKATVRDPNIKSINNPPQTNLPKMSSDKLGNPKGEKLEGTYQGRV